MGISLSHGNSFQIPSSQLGEFQTLSRETDPELYWEAVLHFSLRLQKSENVEASAAILGMIVQGGKENGIPLHVREQAELELDAVVGKGDVGRRLEFLGGRIVEDSLSYKLVIPFALGAGVYQVGRTAALSRFAVSAGSAWYERGLGARFAASFWGTVGEAPMFAISARGLRGLGGEEVFWDPWSVGKDVLGAGIMLGTVKGARFGGEQAFLKIHRLNELGVTARLTGFQRLSHAMIPQASMFGGMMASHGIETEFGLRDPAIDGATFVTDALVSQLSMVIGGSAAHRVPGEAWRRFQMELGIKANLFTKITERKNRPTLAPNLVYAGNGGIEIASEPGARKIENVLMASSLRDEKGQAPWGISEAGAMNLVAETARNMLSSSTSRKELIFQVIARPLQKDPHVHEPLEMIALVGKEAIDGDLSSSFALLELRGALTGVSPSFPQIRAAIELTEAYLKKINPNKLFGPPKRFRSSQQLLDQMNLIEGLVEFNEGVRKDLPRLPWGNFAETIFERLYHFNTLIKNNAQPAFTPFFKTEQSLLLQSLISILSLNQRFSLGLVKVLPPSDHLEEILMEANPDSTTPIGRMVSRIRIYLGLPEPVTDLVSTLQYQEVDPRLITELALRERIPHPPSQPPFSVETILKSFDPNNLDRSNYSLFLDALQMGGRYRNQAGFKQLAFLGEKDPHAFYRLLEFTSPRSPTYDPQAHLAVLEIFPLVENSIRMEPELRELRIQSIALGILMERFPPRLEPSLLARLNRIGVDFMAFTLTDVEARELLKFLEDRVVQSASSSYGPLDRERNVLVYFQKVKKDSLPKGYLRLLDQP